MPVKKKKRKTIINSKPQVCDGIQFRSGLEVYCYKKLKENKIKSKYEKIKYTIIPEFEYNGEKVRAMTYTPDFVGDKFLIECKGRANESFPLRWKIFKYYLKTNNINIKLYKPKNKKEVDAVIKDIIDNVYE